MKDFFFCLPNIVSAEVTLFKGLKPYELHS